MERLLVVWCPELLEEREHGREARATASVADALGRFSPGVDIVRPGVCALGTRGPSRYFGGDEALAGMVAGALGGVENPGGEQGTAAQVGVADGLFAATLAARAAEEGPVVVGAGASPGFVAPWPTVVLESPELADLLARLGIHSVGAFAALPTPHVLARFGMDGVVCHELARGTRGELPGWRRPLRGTGSGREEVGGGTPRQPGFWGGSGAAEARARRAMAKVAELLGPEAVWRGRLQGGRGPAERARLVPWGASATDGGHHQGARHAWGGPPWPGRVPSPAPVVVASRPVPAVLVDAEGRPVGVTVGGRASARPTRLSVDGGRWAPVTGWAGPWPADERWWAGPGRRRVARMQVVTTDGAHLLARERGGWWVEGTYD